MGYAADRSGRAAGAASAGPAARRGADDRVLRACADARSRRSCAADGGPTGGRAQALRQLGARAGYRRAQDLTGRHPAAYGPLRAAAGGTVGGSADCRDLRSWQGTFQ